MSYLSRERSIIEMRLEFLNASEAAKKPHVMDGHDHTACANKVRKAGYMANDGYQPNGALKRVWIEDRSTTDCKYDRKRVDPACAAANCKRIGL